VPELHVHVKVITVPLTTSMGISMSVITPPVGQEKIKVSELPLTVTVVDVGPMPAAVDPALYPVMTTLFAADEIWVPTVSVAAPDPAPAADVTTFQS